MIDSPNPEENKTSDAEMFFAQFQEGAPVKTESKADPEFDKQMESRIAEPVKQPTFKEAFAAARKDPEAIKAGKFYYEDPTGKHTGWKSLALASDKPASKPAMKDMPPVTRPPELTKGKQKLQYESAAERGKRFSYKEAQDAYDKEQDAKKIDHTYPNGDGGNVGNMMVRKELKGPLNIRSPQTDRDKTYDPEGSGDGFGAGFARWVDSDEAAKRDARVALNKVRSSGGPR